MKNILQRGFAEPYRLFFPLGIFFLLWGSMLWLPKIWGSIDSYPVFLHRYLMLNGFVASFISGFLMTAAPRFSQTESAKFHEIIVVLILTCLGLFFSVLQHKSMVFIISSLQAAALLSFMLLRISRRKANPPFSFVFVIIGLFLWFTSGFLSAYTDWPIFKKLHYEGAISAIIIGVGCRLIPAILGHVDVISAQRNLYEGRKPLYSIVPKEFYFIMLLFVSSYLMVSPMGEYFRLIVVIFVSIKYWGILKKPKEKSALTYCLWTCSWMIVSSFILRAFWLDGYIHASHKFFINGVVLLCLLIATRVLQAHGPKDKSIENKKILYLITFLIIFAGITRVIAYVMKDIYFKHLGYSALLLDIAIIIWAYNFLRYAKKIHRTKCFC